MDDYTLYRCVQCGFEYDEALGWPTVAAIDMDGLKRLNDAIGHEAADKVLKRLADELNARAGDRARFYHRSGDEFAARFADPKEGAALVASRAASVPVINAGDGGHMHPTQTLADLATLQSRFGRITDLTVGLCGDLTFGRTVHSLIETLCRFGNVRFVLISPDELKTPQYVIDRINATDNCSYVEVRDLASVIGDLDVLYMTRVQKERFFNEDDYLRLRDTYILDEEKLQLAKPSMAVLHPLPRVNEIAVDVDDDPRAAYFEQVKNGMLVRMALESTVVGDELPGYEPLNPKEVQA